ncbi:hypothetical protein JTB14_031011 [Gonioctena quinquepunctata]|nr:hypothetical protein JTB14_031011 [Gonioctena quinquepunctata]
MDDLKTFISDQNKILFDSLTSQITKLKDIVLKSSTKIEVLESELQELKNKNKKLEKISRENNIIFSSKYQSGNLVLFVLHIMNPKLELQLKDTDINNIYTPGTPDEGIVVKFVRYITKQKVLKSCEEIKGEESSIVKDLSLEERTEQKLLVNYLKCAMDRNQKAHIFRNILYINSESYRIPIPWVN